MKKIYILTLLFAVGFSCPAFSQSFLDKALKKVDKTLNAADELLNGKPAKTQETQSSDAKSAAQTTPSQQTEGQATPKWTSWHKDNLKGRVKTITEIRLWDGEKTTSTWKYTDFGMVEGFKGDDGEVNCDYREINGVWYLAHRNIMPAQRDYPSLEWDGKVYSEADLRAWYPDESGNMPGTETAPQEDVVYTRMDGGRVIKADISRKGADMVPSFYVYDASGNLVFEYMEKMNTQPVREIKYDAQGRKIYEKESGGVVREYHYNDNGDVVYRKTSNTFGEDEDSEDRYTYVYDSIGNWTEKEWKSDGETVATYKRTIEYYK